MGILKKLWYRVIYAIHYDARRKGIIRARENTKRFRRLVPRIITAWEMYVRLMKGRKETGRRKN